MLITLLDGASSMHVAGCAFVLLAALLAIALAAPAPAVESQGVLLGDSIASSSASRVVYRYDLDPRPLLAGLGADVTLALPLDDLNHVEVSLHEHPIMRPGDDSIIYLDAQGHELRRERILARTYLGTVANSGERAEFTIAPEGLYGVLTYRGTQYAFHPESWTSARVVERVEHDAAAPTLSASFAASPLPNPVPSASSAACARTHTLIVQPAAEPSFQSSTPDWANRMMNAYLYASDMWACETSVAINLANYWALGTNYASQAGSCGGLDLGLGNFMNFVQFMNERGVNAYGLWHGYDGAPDISGCAKVQCQSQTSGCLQGYTDVFAMKSAVHAIEAVDLYTSDVYDPSSPDQVGKGAAHELTHNAGEYGHPGNGDCLFFDTYNLMIASASPSCRGVWRTSGTISLVNGYGVPRMR
ncbi:MAG: hypothetical protein QOE90_2536 [Thermoplasmata archaeon]|jgi:hypothetical protein|nr:hypothetical protein [Thermoplasmata archaeon]